MTAGLRTAACFAACVSAAAAGCAAPAARAPHISAGCSDRSAVALTFDDGPNAPFTRAILDILSAKGAKATFFVEGEALESAPDLVRDEVAAGMAIGSHSYSHSPDLPDMSHAAFAEDLDRAEAALMNATGTKPSLYRSPFGHTSNTMLEEEQRRGYTSIGWDVDSGDWSDTSIEDVISNVLNGAHPGAIVLMHDGGLSGGNPDRSTTLAALPRIIDVLNGRGFSLETVPEIIGAETTAGKGHRTCLAR